MSVLSKNNIDQLLEFLPDDSNFTKLITAILESSTNTISRLVSEAVSDGMTDILLEELYSWKAIQLRVCEILNHLPADVYQKSFIIDRLDNLYNADAISKEARSRLIILAKGDAK